MYCVYSPTDTLSHDITWYWYWCVCQPVDQKHKKQKHRDSNLDSRSSRHSLTKKTVLLQCPLACHQLVVIMSYLPPQPIFNKQDFRAPKLILCQELYAILLYRNMQSHIYSNSVQFRFFFMLHFYILISYFHCANLTIKFICIYGVGRWRASACLVFAVCPTLLVLVVSVS